jgi:pimeloyl-ACP methyl ester carboxylesterase
MPTEFYSSSVREIIPAGWREAVLSANGLRQHTFQVERPASGLEGWVVLLHGYMSLGLAWLETARALAADFDLLLPDARGHGASEIDAAGYSVDLVAADTLALLQSLGLRRPALVGHSNGALAALALAAAHPAFASRVVLVDPPMPRERQLDTSAPGFQAWRRVWAANVEALKGMDSEQQTASFLAQQMPGAPGLSGARLALAVEAAVRLDLSLIRDPNPVYPALDPALVDRVTCPVLLITGDPARGGMLVPQVVERLLSNPRVVHVPIPEAGHFVAEDQPECFHAVLRAFLAA